MRISLILYNSGLFIIIQAKDVEGPKGVIH